MQMSTRLYTLLMVDPDVPNEENASLSTYLHWLRPNIPLSALHRGHIIDINDHTKYIAPHPQRGTPYHRYVVLLLPQPPASGQAYSLNTAARVRQGDTTSKHLDIPVIPGSERNEFDVRGFIKEWGLNPAKGGGAHMFREVWNERVSQIYEEVLKTPEPRLVNRANWIATPNSKGTRNIYSTRINPDNITPITGPFSQTRAQFKLWLPELDD